MTVENKMYIVGTKDRPTLFLMWGGELSDDLKDAYIMINHADAEEEIKKCDEPEKFQIFEMKVLIDI